jgi:GDP-4-dehydro-6-deoxy-D-mannose reductase
LLLIIARPFPHTGVGQSESYVVPSFLARLEQAKRNGTDKIVTGNLDPVRDFLDVRDVVSAYLALLDGGEVGQTYNVASGKGYSVRQVFTMLAELVGVNAVPEVDPELARPADIASLVGDATKLRQVTGWQPGIPFEQTLRDMVHAQTN